MQMQPHIRPTALLVISAVCAALLTATALLRAPAPTPVMNLPVQPGSQDALSMAQERVQNRPQDANALSGLGWAWLARVREVGDAGGYAQAQQAFTSALALDAQNVDGMLGMGALALGRHQFDDALRWGERAQTANPFKAQAFGVRGDALLETGRYDEAAQVFQRMIDLRPDVASYSRVSYLRELHGDLPGAIDAMQRAVSASNESAESGLWARHQLGLLHFISGDVVAAQAAFEQVLLVQPKHAHALAGLARVRVAQGDLDAAVQLLTTASAQLPLAEFAISLGEVQLARGDATAASQQFGLARAIAQLDASAGVDVDLDLALFEADHGDAARAVVMARAAQARRPGILADHALAWALQGAGQPGAAQAAITRALRTGSRDATLHYHAAVIAQTNGDVAAARAHAQQALADQPEFHPLLAPAARALLASLK